MATVNQLIRKPRKPKVRKTDVPALEKSPQRRGVCTVYIQPLQRNQTQL